MRNVVEKTIGDAVCEALLAPSAWGRKLMVDRTRECLDVVEGAAYTDTIRLAFDKNGPVALN